MRRGGEGRFLLLDILFVFDIVSFWNIEFLVSRKGVGGKETLSLMF